MTKGVKICLAVAVIIFIAAGVTSLILRRPSDKSYAAIIQDGKTLYIIDLSSGEDRQIRIDSPDGGYNNVDISDGTICISEADCPDKTCIKTGKLTSEGVPIVCLPHRLVIKLIDEPENGG